MNYREARSALNRLPSFDVKPGLERVDRLLDVLGRPQHAFPAVHIAGTNGKGSVAAMLARVLSQAGYKVGRYTSPELLDFRDRIEIDGLWIGEGEFARVVERLLPVFAEDDPPTVFETLTAIALHHFASSSVDLAVVEVGLGGRFDATNVVSPILTVLTNVGRDHLALLGGTVEKIAWEQAGIAKENVPFLVPDLPPAIARIVNEEALKVRARPVSADSITVERAAFDWERATYHIRGGDLPKTISLPLLGSYQQGNLQLVLHAVEILRQGGLSIPNSAVAEGLATVHWPGRFEVISRRPTIILDGAHNLPAARALAVDIERVLPQRAQRHLLFGILADKETDAICRALFPLFAGVRLTRSQSPRALPLDLLTRTAALLGITGVCSATVEEGVRTATEALTSDDALVITGSLTVVREARELLLRLSDREID